MHLEYSALVNGSELRVEAKAHRALAASRMRGEWFNTSASAAIDAVKESAAELQVELLPPQAQLDGTKASGGRPASHPLKKLIGFNEAMVSRISSYERTSNADSFSDAFRDLLDHALRKNGIT